MNKQAQPIQKEGIIKFYNEQKGYGFIIDNVSEEEIFFHRSHVKSEISRKDQNKTVTYTETNGKKGPEAENITIK